MSSSRPALVALVLVLTLPVLAAEDLRTLDVQGQRGQSLEQTRRDRYECHNWAVAQTGGAPPAAPVAGNARGDKRELRRERVGRAVVGATIGGALGGLLSDWNDSHEKVLAGAAAGAAVGAATAGAGRKDEASAEEPSDYLRALTACLEGRGYSVALPEE